MRLAVDQLSFGATVVRIHPLPRRGRREAYLTVPDTVYVGSNPTSGTTFTLVRSAAGIAFEAVRLGSTPSGGAIRRRQQAGMLSSPLSYGRARGGEFDPHRLRQLSVRVCSCVFSAWTQTPPFGFTPDRHGDSGSCIRRSTRSRLSGRSSPVRTRARSTPPLRVRSDASK
jgi:hypothetical protein